MGDAETPAFASTCTHNGVSYRERMIRRCQNVAKFLAVSLCLAVSLHLQAGSPAYPLKRSFNDRFLVDQWGVPVMIVGDSPQSLFVNLSTNQSSQFFADRARYGFNTLWVNLLCGTYTGGRADASTFDGTRPFTAMVPSTGSYDLTTPNEAYFARVDQMVRQAGDEGIQILFDACETGSFLSVMLDNGSNSCFAYGQYLGERYKNFANIIWMSGNDFQTWQTPIDDQVARAVALGILDRDTNHLQTTELNYTLSSSLDDTNWGGILGLNGADTYFPSYAQLWKDYNRPNYLPTFLIEANYEFENLQGPVTTAPILRQQEYWTMTSGACGQLYGNHYTWPFLDGWQGFLDTPGAAQIKIMEEFFDGRAWFDLVPDTNHVVVVSNYGTYSDSSHVADNSFLTAARARDGSLAIIYTPALRAFAVDMAQLSGPAVTRWFDPSSGAFIEIAGSPFANRGVLTFTPPGNNSDGDGGWVLVLETNPPPDLPLPPPPPPEPRFVQQSSATPQSAQAQVSVAFSDPQNAANANIIAIGWNDTNASIANVGDTSGNTYQTAAPTFRGQGLSQAIYCASNIKPGTNTVSVQFDVPAAYVDVRAAEYSGLLPSNSLDAISSATGDSATAASGPISLQTTNELLFAVGMTANQFTGAGAGFTARVITQPDADILEDALAATVGQYSATAPLSAGTWLIQLAAFKPAPPPAPALQILLTASNTIVASWTAAVSGFMLQTAVSLAHAQWQAVTNGVNFVEGQFEVVLPASASAEFYRLVYP